MLNDASNNWKVEKIAVVGPGIVGMPMAAMLAHARICEGTDQPARVMVIQRNSPTSGWKVGAINEGRSPIGEEAVHALIGEGMLSLITPLGPLGLAAGAYVVTSALTQVMGGQVTALVTGPVTIAAAISLPADPAAVAVATAIGCSASFFTPIAHPVNVLMIAPGNYRFRDFLHIGWRLTLVCFIALVAGLALFWRL